MLTSINDKNLADVVKQLPKESYTILESDYAYDFAEWESSNSTTYKPVLVFVDDCGRPITMISRDLALHLPGDVLGKAIERVFDG